MYVDSIENNMTTERNGSNTNDSNNNNVLVSNEESSKAKYFVTGIGGRCMSTQAMQSLYDLRENNILCDAILRLENGDAFNVHRAILSACSDYFRTLFTTTLHSRERTDILLSGIDSEMMNLLLQYVYLRSLDINPENVCQLLVTADYLNVVGLFEMCREYLTKNLSPEICMGVLKFAREHFFHTLERDAYHYLVRHFVLVAQKSKDLLDLPVEELKKLLSSNDLNVKCEEVVWEVILKWINHDPSRRKQYIVDLLKNIRLGLLDTQFFLENVKDHPFVTGNEACRPIIIETLKFLYDLEMTTHQDGKDVTPEMARPRVPHEILFLMGGWVGDSMTSYMETYDTRADRWARVREEDPSGPRGHHGVAAIGFNIYVIGGYNGREYFSGCRCFNAVTKEWREIAPMNSRRCYVSVAKLNDVIYALGGYDGYRRLNTAERYNYRTNQWSMIPSMKMQRSDANATSLNGKVYIVGGFNGHECLSSAEVYDPKTNQWTRITPMRHRRSGVACIAYHGCVYAIGGFNSIARIYSAEKYNPITNSWGPIPDMCNPRSNCAVEVIDDMIFVIGGFSNVMTIDCVECYDEKTNMWYEAADIGLHRSAPAACVIVGLPNVHDYIHKYRDYLVEERKQKLLALEQEYNQRQERRQRNVDGNYGL